MLKPGDRVRLSARGRSEFKEHAIKYRAGVIIHRDLRPYMAVVWDSTSYTCLYLPAELELDLGPSLLEDER